MIIIKYLDGQEKERYGRLIRYIWEGEHQGEYEILPVNRKRKDYVKEDNMLDVYLATKEQEVAMEGE